jgi:type IV secretory pathway VirJ component
VGVLTIASNGIGTRCFQMKTAMHTGRNWSLLYFMVVAAMALVSQSLRAEAKEEVIPYSGFGQLEIYHPSGEAKGWVLLLSGETGWTPRMKEIAGLIAGLDYLVAGIDSSHYLQALDRVPGCGDPARDLEALDRFLENNYPLGEHRPPLLIGYAAGAALVFAALAQAPVGTFHAGISLDFCPKLAVQRTLCRGRTLASETTTDGKGIVLRPTNALQAPWFVFESDQDCKEDELTQFVKHTDEAKLVYMHRNADGASAQKRWLPQFTALLEWLDPRIANQVQADTDVRGVPLTELPASEVTDKRLAVMISGDGGWAALDRGVAAELVKHGISTVGWDSLSYFWQPKTPEQAGRDLERVLRHYMVDWNKERVLLIGYSFGADVLPFMANQLAPRLRDRVELLAFLGLSKRASFEFHLRDWIGLSSTKGTLAVVPEVEKLAWTRRLCIYGDKETDSACPRLASAGVVVVQMSGDHHFGDDYSGVAKHILEQIPP